MEKHRCGIFLGVENADELLSHLKVEIIMWTFHTASEPQNICATGHPIYKNQNRYLYHFLDCLPTNYFISRVLLKRVAKNKSERFLTQRFEVLITPLSPL